MIILHRIKHTHTHTQFTIISFYYISMCQIPIECQFDTLTPTTDFKGKEIYIHSYVYMFLLEQCTRNSIHLYTRGFNLAAVYLLYLYIHIHIHTCIHPHTHTHTHTQLHIYIYIKPNFSSIKDGRLAHRQTQTHNQAL